jgi:GGDEF domain-containing protein
MGVIALNLANQAYEAKGKENTAVLNMAAAMVQTTGQYVVETEPAAVKDLRANLETIAANLRSTNPAALASATAAVLADFRGILRVYRDRASAYLARIRHELASTSEALAGVLAGIQADSGETDRMLADEVANLRRLAHCDDLAEIRTGLEKSSTTLAEYAERLRREKDAIITQLKSEIQSLHRSLDEAQRITRANATTGLISKSDFTRHVRRKLVSDEKIGVVHLSIRNLHDLTDTYPDSAVSEVLMAFARRMKNVIPPTACAGEWGETDFCVATPESALASTASRLEKACPGRYVLMCDGSSRTFELKAVITPIVPNPAEDPEALLARLDELCASR